MFDLDAGKMLIVGIVALLVVGPKDLPHVLRTVGQIASKIRRIATEFQARFADAVEEADLDGVTRDIGKIGDQATVNLALSPAMAVRRQLMTAIEGAKKNIASSRKDTAPDEPTYASPEMKEYLALSTAGSVAATDKEAPSREKIVDESHVPSA